MDMDIMCCDSEDKDRFCAMIDDAIKSKSVKSFAAYKKVRPL